MITKNIRRAALALLLSSLITSCANSPSTEDTAQAEAMAVAQACYDRLLEGDYEGFLAFRNDIDKFEEDMRSELADAYKMYMSMEEQLHKGVKKFTATRAEMDTTMHVMDVFMMLDYGDGTQEEIVVPMIANEEGQWRMK